MKLVIEIDEKNYEKNKYGRCPVTVMRKSIRNGTPLPKGHGVLKDVDAIHEEIHKLQSGIGNNGGAVIISKDQYKGLCYARGIINEAPTIIEADKEGMI